MRLHHHEINLRYKLPYSKSENENISIVSQIKFCKERKRIVGLLLIKTIGDSFLSFSGTRISKTQFV